MDRDRQHVRFGYMAYRLFYDTNYVRKTLPTEEHFEKSNVYDAFVRFGKYIIDVNALSPEEFIRYAVMSKTSVDRWCSDRFYFDYVRLLNRHEDGIRALERNLRLMQSWANQEEGREINNFFRDISSPLAVQWLVSGRISPWVIFNCASGQDLIAGFSPEQKEIVERAVDVKFWKDKFSKNKEEVQQIQDFLHEEGI